MFSNFSKRVGAGFQTAVLALVLLLTTGLAWSDAATLKPAGITINAPTTASGNVGQEFSWLPNVNGAVFPLNATIVYGTLPPGLQLLTAESDVYGVPTATAVSTLTVQITDHDNNSAQATVTITISPTVVPPSPLAITSTSSITVTVGNPVSFNLTASGGTQP